MILHQLVLNCNLHSNKSVYKFKIVFFFLINYTSISSNLVIWFSLGGRLILRNDYNILLHHNREDKNILS